MHLRNFGVGSHDLLLEITAFGIEVIICLQQLLVFLLHVKAILDLFLSTMLASHISAKQLSLSFVQRERYSLSSL
jgi:hypothetical protein